MSHNFENSINDKISRYRNAENLWDKISVFVDKIQLLFSSEKIRDFIFNPIKDIFHIDKQLEDSDIYAIITQVAIVNAVLAGLPGKMGVGVFVSLALETWMAYSIAKKVGVDIESPKDVLKYFSVVGATLFVVFEGFRMLLGVAFSLFSFIPMVNPLIPAELFVTNLVGVIFWIGFKEAKATGSFTVPKRLFLGFINKAIDITKYQWKILRKLLSIKNIKIIQKNIVAWFNGDIVIKTPVISDDVFTGLAMAYLIKGDVDKLKGPVGNEFIEAIRDRFPELKTASLMEISEYMHGYEDWQIPGLLSIIKGRLFERLIALSENSNSDNWFCKLHDNQFNPSTDLVMFNQETGDMFDLSLKATDSTSYIENALSKYPNDMILVTSEVGEKFEDDPRVISSSISNEYMVEVTEDNFNDLLKVKTADMINKEAIMIGTTISMMLALWPFVMAYLKKNISEEQLNKAAVKILGKSGKNLVIKIIAAAALGPLYPWYVMARVSMKTTGNITIATE